MSVAERKLAAGWPPRALPINGRPWASPDPRRSRRLAWPVHLRLVTAAAASVPPRPEAQDFYCHYLSKQAAIARPDRGEPAHYDTDLGVTRSDFAATYFVTGAGHIRPDPRAAPAAHPARRNRPPRTTRRFYPADTQPLRHRADRRPPRRILSQASGSTARAAPGDGCSTVVAWVQLPHEMASGHATAAH